MDTGRAGDVAVLIRTASNQKGNSSLLIDLGFEILETNYLIRVDCYRS